MGVIFGRILRTTGILFFGLTVIMNLLGGIGTTCAAFLTEQYTNYRILMEEGLQWLYQGLVIATILVALVGIWVLLALIKRKPGAIRNGLIVLVVGTILAGIQYYFSQQLFGKAAPANMKFYINAVTLLLFLLILIPGIRQLVDRAQKDMGSGKDNLPGLAAISMGVVTIATPYWAGPSHTSQGENWVALLQSELLLAGIILLVAGFFLCYRNTAHLIWEKPSFSADPQSIIKKLQIPHTFYRPKS
jgi:hypothetical protein